MLEKLSNRELVGLFAALILTGILMAWCAVQAIDRLDENEAAAQEAAPIGLRSAGQRP